MAPAAGDEVRRTVQIALRHIDQHRDRYDTTQKQDSMLEQLIDRHNLEHVPKKSGEEKKRLTTKGYRSRLQRAVTHDRVQGTSLHDLFLKGTSAFQQHHRAKYTMKEESSIQDSEDEGSGRAAPDRAHNPPDTIYIHDPTPPRKMSTVSMKATGTGGEEGKPLASPPWSPITPANVTVAEAPKRKRSLNEEDEEYVPPKKAKTAENVAVGAPLETSQKKPGTQHGSERLSKQALLGKVQKKPSTGHGSEHLSKQALLEKPQKTPSTEHEQEHLSKQALLEKVQKKPSTERGQEHLPKHYPTNNGPAEDFDKTRGLLKLGDDAIHNELNAIWTSIQSFTCSLFEGLEINPDRQAELVTQPHPELEKLFKKMFGQDWLARALSLLTAGVINARRLVDACASTAVHLMVFMERLPWDGPEDLMSSLAGESAGIDRVLVESSSNRHLRLHAVVWKAAANKVLDRDFQKATIRPHAVNLARRFLALMKTQLEYLASHKMPEAWLEKRVSSLANIFTRALVLKGALRSAPDYYEVMWPISGAGVNRDQMEELHPGTGDQEIVWGLSPFVRKKASPDEDWEMACRARVLSRPMPTSRPMAE